MGGAEIIYLEEAEASTLKSTSEVDAKPASMSEVSAAIVATTLADTPQYWYVQDGELGKTIRSTSKCLYITLRTRSSLGYLALRPARVHRDKERHLPLQANLRCPITSLRRR